MPTSARIQSPGAEPGCSTIPYVAGCPCDPSSIGEDSQCQESFPCAGNKTALDYGTCGGDLNTITCPRENATEYVDFWIQNTTRDYCANTQIRTCNDENGCVGVKYRNDTSTYNRCVEEYGNPYTGHYASSGLSLPVKVRIGKEAKYITFVCDPDPGVKVPIVSEFWPSASKGWPRSMPPMGKSNCSECTGQGYCPWRTSGPGSECSCCTRCSPDDGSYPPQHNISINNPTQHPWKVQLLLRGDGKGPAKPSTCVMRDALSCEASGGVCPPAQVEAWQNAVDAAAATQVPPGAKNFVIGIPPGVTWMNMIPMYTTELSTCVVEGFSNGYAPNRIDVSDKLPWWCKKREDCPGQDCNYIRAPVGQAQ